jgi:hypothetical protein
MNSCIFRLSLVSTIALAACAQSGCTTDMWDAANRADRCCEMVKGVVRADDPKRPTALIVTYGGSGIRSVDYLIPLDPSGAPPTPLAYRGNRRTIEDIEKDIHPEQLEAVGQYKFTTEAQTVAAKAMNTASYTPLDSSYSSFRDWITGPDVAVIALKPDGTTLNDGNTSRREPLPDGCRVLLLPGHQPRPVTERKKATAGAVLLTPVTAAADAVLLPVGFVSHWVVDRCP